MRKKSDIFSSNTFRLSLKELLLVAVIVVGGIMFILPLAWGKIEKFKTGGEFRIAEKYRDDYWTYQHWVEQAVKNYPVIFLGDSVVWGMYVDNANTLPAKLNRKLHGAVVANLAIDGLHPVALAGLLENYGAAIRNKTVLLHFNPLWLNSRKYDLSDDEEMQVHHPRLIPQFSPKFHCYTESFSGRMNIWRERHLPFYLLLNHVRLAFFNNEEINQWMVDNPYKNPLAQPELSVAPGETEKQNSTENWRQKGITLQDWNWVDLDKSFQWQSFTNVVQLLRQRDNRVEVMVGPLNPYMLTPSSLAKFRQLQQEVCAWLKTHNIPYVLIPDLPSETYADASHPLAPGYEKIAETLMNSSLLNSYKGKPVCAIKP